MVCEEVGQELTGSGITLADEILAYSNSFTVKSGKLIADGTPVAVKLYNNVFLHGECMSPRASFLPEDERSAEKHSAYAREMNIVVRGVTH